MNEKKNSLKKNFLYNTLFQVLNVIIPFITAPYTARVLGADGIGVQSFTASMQSYFLLLANLGTMAYGTREIAVHREDEYKRSKIFWEIELLSVFTSLFALLLWIIFVVFSSQYKEYYIALSIVFLGSMLDITWFFNGIEHFKTIVLCNAFFKLCSLFCLFIFIKSKEDLLLYIYINVIIGVLSSLSLWIIVIRYLKPIRIKELSFINHFRESLIFFIPTIATSIYLVLDKTLIGLITRNEYENGYYQQAQKILDIFKSIVFLSINSVMVPRISYLYSQKNFDDINDKINESLNYILFMGIGSGFGIAAIAKTFIPLYFGSGYENVVILIYISFPLLVIIGLSSWAGTHYYTPFGLRKKSSKYIVIGAGINLFLNLIMIPYYKSFGAAVASVIAELIITTLYIINSDGYCSTKKIIKNGYKKLFSGCLMFAFVYLINYLNIVIALKILIQLISGVLLYVIVLLLLKDKWTLSIFIKIGNYLKKINRRRAAK